MIVAFILGVRDRWQERRFPRTPRALRRAFARLRPSGPRWEIASAFAKAVFALTCCVMSVYVVFSLVAGSDLITPHSAGGVLAAAENPPSSYVWSSEERAYLKIGSQSFRVDSNRTAVIDGNERFEGLIQGVFPHAQTVSSNGQVVLGQTNDDTGKTSDLPLMLTNLCAHEKAPASTIVAMPSGRELRALHPVLHHQEELVAGQRSWVLDFTPSAQLVRELLWLPLYTRVRGLDPRYAIAPSDLQALESGKVEAIEGKAWVRTSKPRRVVQIEVNLRFKGGASYQFLASLRSSGGHPLAGLNFGKPSCQG